MFHISLRELPRDPVSGLHFRSTPTEFVNILGNFVLFLVIIKNSSSISH